MKGLASRLLSASVASVSFPWHEQALWRRKRRTLTQEGILVLHADLEPERRWDCGAGDPNPSYPTWGRGERHVKRERQDYKCPEG